MMIWSIRVTATFVVLLCAASSAMSIDRVEKSAETEGDSVTKDEWIVPCVVRIEAKGRVKPGRLCRIELAIEGVTGSIESFDLLIAYDPSALQFLDAILLDSIRFDPASFDYEVDAAAEVIGAAGGLINAHGLGRRIYVESSSGVEPGTVASTALLRFLVFATSNPGGDCAATPIRFYWRDCTDNTIVARCTSDSRGIVTAHEIRDYPLTDHPPHSRFHGRQRWAYIENPFTGFPTVTGPQEECLRALDSQSLTNATFINGGVSFRCSHHMDPTGDINLNNQGYELKDLELFSDFLMHGPDAFEINQAGQMAATDVNADGLTMGVADLVYLTRVITGDALPYAKVRPVSSRVAYEDGVMSVADSMGAAYVMVGDSVVPELLAEHMEMRYHFDGRQTNILISSREVNTKFIGPFLKVGGPIAHLELATYEGATVLIRGDE